MENNNFCACGVQKVIYTPKCTRSNPPFLFGATQAAISRWLPFKSRAFGTVHQDNEDHYLFSSSTSSSSSSWQGGFSPFWLIDGIYIISGLTFLSLFFFLISPFLFPFSLQLVSWIISELWNVDWDDWYFSFFFFAGGGDFLNDFAENKLQSWVDESLTHVWRKRYITTIVRLQCIYTIRNFYCINSL